MLHTVSLRQTSELRLRNSCGPYGPLHEARRSPPDKALQTDKGKLSCLLRLQSKRLTNDVVAGRAKMRCQSLSSWP